MWSLILAVTLGAWSLPGALASASLAEPSRLRLEGLAYQVSTDFARRCAEWIDDADLEDELVNRDVVTLCKALVDAGRDGTGAPDDCVYFTTVTLEVPVKQAVEACNALLQQSAGSSGSIVPASGVAGGAPKPSAGAGPSVQAAGGGPPPWIDELMTQLATAQIQLRGTPPNPSETEAMRACLLQHQGEGRGVAFQTCARQLYAPGG